MARDHYEVRRALDAERRGACNPLRMLALAAEWCMAEPRHINHPYDASMSWGVDLDDLWVLLEVLGFPYTREQCREYEEGQRDASNR